MIYRLLADLTVVIHFAYVLFVVVGLLMTALGWLLSWDWVRNRWFRGIHLAMIGVVVLEAWIGFTCPLTTWEHRLREAGGQESYQGDFIANWVHEAMFFEVEPWVFTLCYSLFGGLVLATIIFIPPRWRKSAILDALMLCREEIGDRLGCFIRGTTLSSVGFFLHSRNRDLE